MAFGRSRSYRGWRRLFADGRSGGAGDEGIGEAELGAKVGFAGGHLALVGLVVETGEMEEAVKQEDAELVGEGVAVFGGLAGGGVEGDGEIARVLMGCWQAGDGVGWEAEDVGGFVFVAEGAVEALELSVGGEEDGDGALEGNGGSGAVEEAREGWLVERR